ncbi:hypothetical protein BZA70DRAFT_268480 [Myxozyma melibiosi]|uniref:VLRF1 domain-containing protein n=1 Tax=Myxozyma melibiosi TaxID=54550 RepID=A0ABR1F2J9_9ASCO
MSSKPSPFYVYSLPATLLASLTPTSFSTSYNPEPAEETISLTPASDPVPQSFNTPTSGRCNTCDLDTESLEDQRAHFKSDLHRFNVKRKIAGQDAVGQAEFEKLLDELEESISGSDSDSDDSDVDKVSALFGKSSLAAVPEDETEQAKVHKSPFHTFDSPLLPSDEVLAIYKCLFPAESSDEGLELIKKQQFTSDEAKGKETPVSAIFMLGGGHFAGAVISHTQNMAKKNDPVTVLLHKTVHRYTTRRKQGGSQSANDNAKGKASSAGSSIRRHNEAMLEKEVRELLEEWKPYLDRASHIFIRANGRQNRGVFFGYEGAVLNSRDSRVKGIPFTTRRATGDEVKRVWGELTRPRIAKREMFMPKPVSKPVVAPAATAATAAEKKEPEEKELTPEELHTMQIVAMVKKSRLNPLGSYLAANKLTADFRFEPAAQYHHTPTALHLAASLSLPRMVTYLLITGKADPTISSEEGRTAWELSGDRATREAFRLARGELEGKSSWDWAKSGVGSALTKRDIAEREAKEKAELASERAEAVRRLEQQQQQKQQQQKTATAGGKKLASSVVTGVSANEQLLAGLTPEARMRIERERRARAVEARMAAARRQ